MTSIFEKLVPRAWPGAARQLREHIHTPLYANAYILIVNQGLSAVLGLVYWVLAARFYSADMVGKGSAIISTLGFISAIAEFSLKSGMQRFVPQVGQHVRRLVLLTYGVNLLATGILTVGFFAIGDALHIAGNLLKGARESSLALLVFATMFYTIFIVQDGVLMGLRQTIWVLLENTFYNVGKIVLLVLGIFGIFQNAIVASWFLPPLLLVLVVNGLIFFSFIPRYFRSKPPAVKPARGRQIVRSVSGDHAGTILSEVSIRLIPLLVVSLLGTSANAYFYQAWLIGNMLNLVSANVSASFSVEGASDPARLAHYSRQTLRQILLLIVPMAAVLVAAAPLLLQIYGGEYARQATPVLRWLAVAAIPYGVNAWFLSYARIRAEIRSIILTQAIQCVLTIGLSAWWMPRMGITAIGLAWLIAQTSIFILVVIKTWRLFFQQEPSSEEPAQAMVTPAPAEHGLEREYRLKSISFGPENSPRIGETGEIYLFLSPHLDDAVLSCGGYISRLSQEGKKAVVVTFFTADLPEGQPVSWLARRNLNAWNMQGARSPFAERRQEDIAAARLLGVETVHLGLLDAMYRRSASGAFFYPENTVAVPVDAEDQVVTGGALRALIQEVVARYAQASPLYLFAPLGIGAHVDHVLVRNSAEAVFGQEALNYYEEIPYATRKEYRQWLADLGTGRVSAIWKPARVMLTPQEIEARIAAAACYISQIRGLFPTPIERSFEILFTRVIAGKKPGLGRRAFRADRYRPYERVARSLTNYIDRVGGEKYWHVSSPPPGGAEYAKSEVFNEE